MALAFDHSPPDPSPKGKRPEAEAGPAAAPALRLAPVVETAPDAAAHPDQGGLRRRLALIAAMAAAAAGGFLLGDPAAAMAADAELATLLRGMAGVKAILALGAAGAVWWRLGRAIGARGAAVYVGAVAAMAGGTALIWQLTALGWTSLVFHAALITLAVAALRDDTVLPRRRIPH